VAQDLASTIELPRARGRLDERTPVSVIDIGSNSVRLVVYEGATRSPTPLFNEKVLCGLGRSVAATGRLEGDGIPRTLEALSRFRAISAQLGAGKPWVVATAAVRDAENGAAFVADIERVCGGKVMLLSGHREAELAALGIQSGFHLPDGIAGDLGGGSLELIDIATQGLQSSTTLPLGGLRLANRAGNNLDKAERAIEADLATVPWLKRGAGRPFFAVGGTWRNIARLHMEEFKYPLHITHGYAIPASDASAFCESIIKGRRLKHTDLGRVSGARREVLPLGALVLQKVIQRLGASEVIFSVHGIREGLLYALLPKTERERDPLIAHCEDYAVLRSRSPVHGYELCAWTDQFFTGPGPKETAEQRRLRHAACLMSDISWRAHPDYRGEQSIDLIARASLAGVGHPGRVFIALAVCYRHIGESKLQGPDSKLLPLLPPAEQARALLVGTAIRAIHMLSAGAAGIIPRTPISFEPRKLVLTIPKDLAVLNGERLRKRFGVVAGLLERQADIRVAAR
jgi:exopolyphosphatase / guanosine-5'-triphosphate,3'-diphosphate pyrophosphatase